jgi:hypothetical protein
MVKAATGALLQDSSKPGFARFVATRSEAGIASSLARE